MYFPTPAEDDQSRLGAGIGPFPDAPGRQSVEKPWANLSPDQRHNMLWPLVERLALKNDLDPSLVMAVVQVESRFRPWVVSNRGAMGLMQINQVTAEHLGLERPMDPMANLEAGVRYLAYLYDRVQMYNKRPQRYGTQLYGGVDGGLKLWTVEDPDNLDKRREELGLPPIREYLKFFELDNYQNLDEVIYNP